MSLALSKGLVLDVGDEADALWSQGPGVIAPPACTAFLSLVLLNIENYHCANDILVFDTLCSYVSQLCRQNQRQPLLSHQKLIGNFYFIGEPLFMHSAWLLELTCVRITCQYGSIF